MGLMWSTVTQPCCGAGIWMGFDGVMQVSKAAFHSLTRSHCTCFCICKIRFVRWRLTALYRCHPLLLNNMQWLQPAGLCEICRLFCRYGVYLNVITATKKSNNGNRLGAQFPLHSLSPMWASWACFHYPGGTFKSKNIMQISSSFKLN